MVPEQVSDAGIDGFGWNTTADTLETTADV